MKRGVRVSEDRLLRKIVDAAWYAQGKSKPHYPMPAVIRCQWCYSANDVCDYNGDGYWCPSLCFE